METNIAEEDLRRKRQKVSSTTSILPLQNAVANNPRTTTAMDSSNVAEAIMGRNSKEEEVGITEYVDTSIPGFTGVLKKRYVHVISFLSFFHSLYPLQLSGRVFTELYESRRTFKSAASML